MTDTKRLYVAIESAVYSIDKQEFAEAKIYLDNQRGTDNWDKGLDMIISKGKFLYNLAGNFNY